MVSRHRKTGAPGSHGRLVRTAGWAAVALLAAHSVLLMLAALPGTAVTLSGLSYLASNSAAALAVQTALALTVWSCFALPRARRGAPSTFGTVAALGILAFVLAFVSYLPCSGAQAPVFTPLSRALLIFLGSVDDPFGTVDGCAGAMPLALQAARLGAVIAVGIGIASALALLFRSQLDRVLVRFAKEVDLVIGSPHDNRALLERMSAGADRGRRVVILTADDPGTALPPRVSALPLPSTDYELPRVLRRTRPAPRTARITSVYLLLPEVTQVLSWLHACRAQLAGVTPRPVVVARIDDVWQAEHWRRELISPDDSWLVDVISPYEQTSRAITDRLIARGVDRVVVVGRSPLRLALASAIAQRRRERTISRGRVPNPPTLIFAGEDAETAAVHHLAHQSRFGNVDDVGSDSRPVTDASLVESMRDAASPAVVITDVDAGISASALASRHPDWTILARDAAASGLPAEPVMAGLFPFDVRLDLHDEGELHVWERAARIIHDNYLHDYGLGAGPASVPWAELGSFYRDSNQRLVNTALASALAVGRTWGAFDGPSSGSRHGVPDEQLWQMARNEHEQWMAHYRRHGWRYSTERDDDKLTHPRLLEWNQLDEDSRARTVQGVSDALEVLAALGYRSTARAGLPSALDPAPYERIGEVTAVRSDSTWSWTAEDGSPMRGAIGDWRVQDDTGRSWSVAPAEFAGSYRHLAGDRFARAGLVTARPGVLGEQIATLEGPSRVTEASWVVQSAAGARWIVPDAHFRANYRPAAAPAPAPDSEPDSEGRR